MSHFCSPFPPKTHTPLHPVTLQCSGDAPTRSRQTWFRNLKNMPLCFSSNQTCNRCSFSVDVHTVAALLQSRFPTLPAKRVEMNLSPWPFFFWVCVCVCSRMCHRQHLLSLSYFSTLCVFVCAFSLLLFFPSLPHFHSQSLALAKSIVRVALFLSSRRLLLYTCLFALAVLRWERPNLFLLCVTSV